MIQTLVCMEVHGMRPLNGLFSIRERYVDFNLAKTLKHLNQLCKSSVESMFERMVKNPSLFARRDRDQLVPEFASRCKDITMVFVNAKLGLAESQKVAFAHMCSNRLTLLWGPPGTGKTHCLALSCIQLFEIQWRANQGRPFRILMTAFTNTAIECFLTKFRSLLGERQRLLSDWARSSKILQISHLQKQQAIGKHIENAPFVLLVATVWKISKDVLYRKTGTFLFDMLLIDEASQLQVADASIPISVVKSTGRIAICGDHLQLRPLLKQSFPDPVSPCDPLLATGILQCLLRSGDPMNERLCDLLDTVKVQAEACCLVALREQRRMCEPLSRFTERIYTRFDEPRAFVPLDPLNGNGRAAHVLNLCRTNALVSVKLTCENLSGLTYDVELKYEANVVCRIVKEIVASSSNSFSIFVITPHCAQRSSCTQALARVGIMVKTDDAQDRMVTVDTVDRMQGHEADIVIVCYSFMNRDRVESEMDFIFDLNRVNVAISRAKRTALLLCSDIIIHPPMSVANTLSRQLAFDHLLHFYKESSKLNWDCGVGDNGELVDLSGE
jgi:DNA replication ATP-dependent helicase Dna2